MLLLEYVGIYSMLEIDYQSELGLRLGTHIIFQVINQFPHEQFLTSKPGFFVLVG